MVTTDAKLLDLVDSLQTAAKSTGAPPALGMILLVDKGPNGEPLEKFDYLAVALQGEVSECCSPEAALIQVARLVAEVKSAFAAIAVSPVKNGLGQKGLIFTLESPRMRKAWVAQRDTDGVLGEFEPTETGEADCFFGVFDLVN